MASPESSKSIFSVIKAQTFPSSKAKTSLVRSSTDPTTPPVPSQKPLTIAEQYEQMPLKRRIAALNRVNVLRAYLGLPEKNLDKTLRPRKPRQIDEPVQQPSSENDSAISVYSQESEAEQTHSDSSEDDSTDEQTASESDQVAEEQVWKDPYAYLDDPSQLSEVEQCP